MEGKQDAARKEIVLMSAAGMSHDEVDGIGHEIGGKKPLGTGRGNRDWRRDLRLLLQNCL
jgi:hypothetical protein